MPNVWQHDICVRSKLLGSGGTGQDSHAQHPRRTCRFEIVNTISDHCDGAFGQVHMGRKGVQLTRRRLAPVASIETRDKIEHIIHPSRHQMRPRGMLCIIGGNAKVKPLIAKPL